MGKWVGGLSDSGKTLTLNATELRSKGTAGFVIGETFDMGTGLSVPAGQAPTLSFEAIVGESYRVLYTDSLVDPD